MGSWVRKIPWRRDRLPTPLFLGFPCGSTGKESGCNVGDLGLMPVLGRSPGEGKGYPLQYCDLENSRDCIVHGVAKSQTQLSNFHFTFILYMRKLMFNRESELLLSYLYGKDNPISLSISLNTVPGCSLELYNPRQ